VARARKSSSGFGTFVFGFLVALVVVAAALFVYLRYQAPRQTVASLPAPIRQVVSPSPSPSSWQPQPVQSTTASSPTAPAAPRAHSEHTFKQPPFGISEDVYEAGAHVYRQDCARCHGTPGRDASFGAHLHPAAPQLWNKHPHSDVVGVSDDPPGETYAKAANGIPHTPMPAFGHRLTERQLWEVSLLLKNADQPLPDPVQHILTAGKP
jgi:thiosulfate dehydrogenase